MTDKVESKPHLSPSQVLMLQRCPAQWYYRYKMGLKVPPSAAMSLGSSVDTGISHNYEQKVESHEDMPLDDVLDAFSTDFEDRKDETAWDKDEKPGEFKDDGARVIKKYQVELAPTVQPKVVQEPIRLEIPNYDYDLLVVPDLIQSVLDAEIVRDTKVVAKSPAGVKTGKPLAAVHHQTQLAFYGMARSAVTGKACAGASVDYLVRTKEAKVVPVEVELSENAYKYVKNLVGLTAKQIELNHFPPNRQSMMCSRKYCGYWRECEKDFGGTVKE